MNLWNTKEFMDSIGYEPIPDEGTYKTNDKHSRYQNKPGTQATFYGYMGKGKRLVYFNTDFTKGYIFVQIEEDGGTRKVFHGGCKNEEQFLIIMECCY